MVGLADDQPAEEGAERRGEAELGRGQPRPQAQHQRDQQEQLDVSGAGDAVEQRRHHPERQPEDGPHHGQPLAERRQHVEGAGALRARGQRREQEEHHDHGQVLHEQGADGQPPVDGLQLLPLHEELGDDHRAADGDGCPEGQRLRARQPGRAAQPDEEPQGQEDPEQPAPQRDRAHPHQLLERELQPQGEHEQQDAQLGQLLHDGELPRPRRGHDRPDERAPYDVPQEGREPEDVRQRAPDRRGQQRQDQVTDERRLRDDDRHRGLRLGPAPPPSAPSPRLPTRPRRWPSGPRRPRPRQKQKKRQKRKKRKRREGRRGAAAAGRRSAPALASDPAP